MLKTSNVFKLVVPSKRTICANALSKRFFGSQNYYDIIISGGGMVGSTLGCTLGKNPKLSNKKILLLEASKEKPYKKSSKYSNRVVSLNPGTRSLLQSIGAWEFIEKCRYATVKRLQVWDAISNAEITFGEADFTDDISYIVETDLLLGAVNEELKNIDNVEVVYSAKVKDIHLPEYDENRVKIVMDDDKVYSCDLLLGCDGVNSQVRKTMQVHYLTWNYNQMGLVATLNFCEGIDNKIGWQRFLPSGPVALLPLTEYSSSLVWSTSPEHAKELLGMSDQDFVDALNEALHKSYKHNGIIDQVTNAFDTALRMTNCSSDVLRQLPPKIASIEENSRAIFPLGFGHASHYIGKGVALVGDAAHRIHPLAGQGVNLGFGDVVCLNAVLGDAVYSGGKINDLSYLKRYETERQRHNIPMMLAVDGLHRLYNTESTPFVLLRSLGLQATHALGPLKKAIMSQAAV